MNLDRVRATLDAPLPLSPDGQHYMAMAQGHGQPRPFMFRWLAPYLLGTNPRAWRGAAYASAVCISLVAWSYTGAWAALFIPLGLAGVVKVNVRCPVLVDLPAMMYALAAAVCVRDGWWWLGIVMALLAGATKETAPVFAALWAWSPIPLVGLLVPALTVVFVKPKPYPLGGLADEALAHPVRVAWSVHRTQRTFAWWVLPWGVLVLGVAHPTLQVALTLAVAYGQCLVATDLVRMYQWAWPVLALNTFHVVPRAWWPVLVVLHLASPHKGEGH